MADHEEHKDDHGGSHGGGGHGGHGGGGHAEGEHEGAPEWLISFADNVALMMGFFVILLAMNMQKPKAGGIGGEAQMGGTPTTEMIDFVIAMRKEFNNPIDLNSDDPAEAPFRKRIRELLESGESNQPDDPGPGREHQAIRPTDFSNHGGNVNFEDDSTTLTEAARDRARTIGARLKSQRFMIEVRGHCSPSEAQLKPHRAFALGNARAMAVAEQLAAQGVPWRQMRLVSCADNARLTSREQSYDREHDRQNQRVEVIVTGESFSNRELPSAEPAESPTGAAAPSPAPGH
jgi:flagellar motor protein MotB